MKEREASLHKLKDWIVAWIEFPLTLKRLAEAIEEHTTASADLGEVGRDFNTGFYQLFGGKVSYSPRDRKDGGVSKPPSF